MLSMLAIALVAATVPPDLAAAVAAYDRAQIQGDRVALQRLLADDYLLVNSTGQLESKEQLIADYTEPGFKLEPFVIEQPVQRAWAGGAVMGGVATLKGVDDGKAYSVRLRFTDVWAKRKGVWQVIYTQAARTE